VGNDWGCEGAISVIVWLVIGQPSAKLCEATKNGNQGMGDITLGPTSSAKTPVVYVNRMEGHTHRLCPSQS